MDADAPYDLIVLGAGHRGLAAALQALAATPGLRALVMDTLPQPGGRTQTVRSNGYVCELGAFAFALEDLAALRELLPKAPQPLEALPDAGQGACWTGERLDPLPVSASPLSFRSGSDVLAQAARMALGQVLRLGRAVTAVLPVDAGFAVTLGGEVPTTLTAQRLVSALPLATAARLFAPLDPALAAVAERLRSEPRAFAFLGGDRRGDAALAGYGAVPADGIASPVQETIFCSNVFAGRALPGRFLVRSELRLDDLPATGDDDVLALAERELRRWTGLTAPIGFTKLHRFAEPIVDASAIECRIRLAGLAARATGLAFAAG